MAIWKSPNSAVKNQSTTTRLRRVVSELYEQHVTTNQRSQDEYNQSVVSEQLREEESKPRVNHLAEARDLNSAEIVCLDVQSTADLPARPVAVDLVLSLRAQNNVD